MPETRFYFVRHGETEYNRLRIMQGRLIDSMLNERGHRQAEALADRLAEVPLDVIVSSELRRAVQTADAVASRHRSVQRERLCDLDEMSWGILEGEPWSDGLAASIDEINQRWQLGEYDFRIENGESIRDVQERGVRAVEQVLARHAGGTILVVTHGRLLRILLSTLLDYGLARMDEFHHANTGVNLLTHCDGCFEFSLLNCTVHLGSASTVLVE